MCALTRDGARGSGAVTAEGADPHGVDAEHDFVVVANRLPVAVVESPDGSAGVAAQPGRPGQRAGAGHAAGRRCLGRLVRDGGNRPGPVRHRRHAPGRRAALGRRGRAVLRRVLQRHAVAAVPRRDRPAAVRRPLVGRLHAGQRPVRGNGGRVRGAPRDGVGARLPAAVGARLLRRRRPDLRIGFFNHIPFPGYEIYRTAAMAPADRAGTARRRPDRVPTPSRRHQLPAGLPPRRVRGPAAPSSA